jgi:hypothetical protein
MQINIKACRKYGKTTLLVNYVLEALEGKTNKEILICASNKTQVLDLADLIIDTAMKRSGYLKEPVKDTARSVTLNGNILYKLALYGDVKNQKYTPDIIAIDDIDSINEQQKQAIMELYDSKKTFLITTETE